MMDAHEMAEKRRIFGDLDYVNWCLQGTYPTPASRRKWWIRPRIDLDGHTPIEVWDTRREDVIGLAESLLA